MNQKFVKDRSAFVFVADRNTESAFTKYEIEQGIYFGVLDRVFELKAEGQSKRVTITLGNEGELRFECFQEDKVYEKCMKGISVQVVQGEAELD